ncbi:MAG: hypothetical protein HS116_25380 [Planctomycetes bacterium]|nr:hypothetical protein [Planctomycetota bacterium]
MSEGHGRAAWAHTSAILALLANAHRDPKKHSAFTPGDFNPYEAQERCKPHTKTRDLSVLKAVFVDHPQGGSKP